VRVIVLEDHRAGLHRITITLVFLFLISVGQTTLGQSRVEEKKHLRSKRRLTSH
jgi:hypothetical protein